MADRLAETIHLGRARDRETVKEETEMIALDLFAGTGWNIGARGLGIQELGVEIMDEAFRTRELNGMKTVYRDVWEGVLDPAIVPAHDLLIASPPCQSFSTAGHGAGRDALDDVLSAIREGIYKRPMDLFELTKRLDDRTALVLTPLVHAYRERPRLVVFEQVPPVLPVWEACAAVMRELGYSVAVGIVNAEQFGVPQTRRRAILMARRDGRQANLPTPTHSRYYANDPDRLDAGVLPWVSMADAIGWGMTHRPFVTLGNACLRAEGVGGSGAKKAIYREKGSGHWKDGGSFPLTAREAAILQSYPAGMTFAGTKTMQALQIGNCVPPLLSRACQAELTAAPAPLTQMATAFLGTSIDSLAA